MITNSRHTSSSNCTFSSTDENLTESGYTLQTLIIIAILVLGATISFTFIYAILDDSTDNIVGGSESYRGFPGPPQSFEYEILDPVNNMAGYANIKVSWDAPSYLGENQFVEYSLVISNRQAVKDDCDNSLDSEEGDSCTISNIEVCNMLMPMELDLRLTVELTSNNRTSNNRSNYNIKIKPPSGFCENIATLAPSERMALESLSPIRDLEFNITSVSENGVIIPKVTVTSRPCDDGRNQEVSETVFTLYWSETQGPRSVQKISFEDCEKTIPINSRLENTEYSVRLEAVNSVGEMQASETVTWLATSVSAGEIINAPTQPRNLKVFTSDNSELFFTWDSSEVNIDTLINRYHVTGYTVRNNYACSSTRISNVVPPELSQLDDPTLLVFDFLPGWEEIAIDSSDVCFELEAEGNKPNSRSSATIIRSPEPYEIFDGVFSWIKVRLWGDEATLTWKATNPSNIVYFNIVELADMDDECYGTEPPLLGGTFRSEPFGSEDTFSKTIGLDDKGFICIIVRYNDGFERKLTYRNNSGNIPLRKGTNIEDLKLGNVGGNLNLTAAINRRYHTETTTYYICLDFQYQGKPWNTSSEGAEISIQVTGSRTDYEATGAIITPSYNSHAFVYQTTTEIEEGQMYEARAWTSSTVCDTYPSEGGYVEASYPES